FSLFVRGLTSSSPLIPYFPTRRSSDLVNRRARRPARCHRRAVDRRAFDRRAFDRPTWQHGDMFQNGLLANKVVFVTGGGSGLGLDRKSTRLNSSHVNISYAVFCLKKKL